MKRIPCTGCSLLCDDIMVNSSGLFIDEVIGACLKGKEKFDQLTSNNRFLNPMLRKGGELKKVSWDEALEKAAEILKSSLKPILYGFSTSSCEAQVKAIELAKTVNGFIDSNSSICQGNVLDAAKETGITLTSIAEIINKADVLVYWGFNGAESIPRLTNKAVFSRGKFRMTGREIKTLIVIDPVKTASFNVMGAKDIALNIEPDKDLELINILTQECCKAGNIPDEGAAGLDKDDIKRLLVNLVNSENVVIFIGQGLLDPKNHFQVARNLLKMVEVMNEKHEKGRVSVVLTGGHYNMAGFDHVALSMTGKEHNIQFSEHKLTDSQYNLISKIKNEDFDCSLIVGTDPISHFPFELSKKLTSKPIILIDNKKSATSEITDVLLPSAITGIECRGTAVRLDQVPVELQKLLEPANNVPSDEKILSQIINKLKDNK
ncbi:MAG: formylmethanofuran dehydrogenase subunit B [Candidatus Lokiarchaeota archaeon]|nr:formylmethanofuran dehydrogenase subunit B [Candidatus Lokiarchaeota archaeon]MBD3341849.1 formylmethanofuran dehydrogenase subunit B [Candidatus Lokiarchaeota archaeon]